MAIHLASVVDTYLNDTSFRDESRRIIAEREASIPTFKKIVTQFVESTTDIRTFRQQLDNALHAERSWGATGTSFLMEINKLAKNHSGGGSTMAEQQFRHILSGLNAANLGERIEQFYLFALQEQERLKKAGMATNKAVFPGNSAAIISLLAFWLDRPGRPIVYYPSLRRGLKMLLAAGAIPKPGGLKVVEGDRVDVRSNADHQAVLQALASLTDAAPKLVQAVDEAYWAEWFLLWITDNPSVLEEEAEEPGEMVSRRVFEDTPLLLVPEPGLSQEIAQLRRHVLVEEATIRHIYHALLAGHVILAGPPGTGKTELARLIPELLWQHGTGTGNGTQAMPYTTTLVTATDEWSTSTLIGSIAPNIYSGQVSYRIKYGHLFHAIAENWAVNVDDPKSWFNPSRASVNAVGALERSAMREYRGRWLVIDEFNRAHIDVALGEALTALSGSDVAVLRVPTEESSAQLPLPRDFRIIGTLNSFDRSYLNQMSEALKRRFSFIEILPPSRARRGEEQGIVLYKALKRIQHLSESIEIDNVGTMSWQHYTSGEDNQRRPYVMITVDVAGAYHIQWTELDNGNQIQEAFAFVWRVFEVIRIYRQLGTAQAIAMVQQMLIAIISERYVDMGGCLQALDAALCDTLADQLQVLLPDELEVLLWSLRYDRDSFISQYHEFLADLPVNSHRRRRHLEALGVIVNDAGVPLLIDSKIDDLCRKDKPRIEDEILVEAFHLDHPLLPLPQFTRRLRTFLMERGL